MIKFTSEAVQEIKRLSKQRCLDLSQQRVRVGLQVGCCADFSYILSFEDALNGTDDDQSFDCGFFNVVVSREYTEKLQGVTIDYSEDLMGGTFRYLNPNAAYTSDCGNSFAITPQPISKTIINAEEDAP